MNITLDKAKVSKRVLATIIDYFITTFFFFTFVMIFGEPNDEGGKTVTGLPAFIPIAFWFGWMILPEAIFGATAGHEIMGLKVVSIDGSKVSFGQSCKRRLCDAIDISWCFGLIAYILVKNTTNSQRLGDIWGHTLVVDKSAIVDFKFEFETADVKDSR
jgi:uncharacterized RDD family membrane protein YckC